MAGLAKIETFRYDKNGKYLNKYKTFTEVQKEFYNTAKYPLFRNKALDGFEEMHVLPDSTLLFKNQVGRDYIRKYLKIISSKYVFRRLKVEDKPITMYNLLGEELARFKSIHVASVLTNISYKSIYSDITLDSSTKVYSKECYFRYS